MNAKGASATLAILAALLVGIGPPRGDGPATAHSRPADSGVPGNDAYASAMPPPGEAPVLLVPGWFDTGRDLAALRIRLIGAGWPSEWVSTLSFERPTGSNRLHAAEIADAVDRLLEAAGTDRVDIVAHSMGGLATRWYLLTEESAPVRRVAFIASPHHGTVSAYFAWGEGRDEMLPESPFLDTLNSASPVPTGVEAITIRTPFDTHVVPGESAMLESVPDHEVCCPTHAGLVRDAEVFRIVLDFLEHGPD